MLFVDTQGGKRIGKNGNKVSAADSPKPGYIDRGTNIFNSRRAWPLSCRLRCRSSRLLVADNMEIMFADF